MQSATNEFNHCYINITMKGVTAHLTCIGLLLYSCCYFLILDWSKFHPNTQQVYPQYDIFFVSTDVDVKQSLGVHVHNTCH